MSREIVKMPEHVYMVKDNSFSRPYFYGPYSTFGAAKGKRTREINYGRKDPAKIDILKSPPGDWTPVDA
jgi:hypothetical protein